MTRRRSIIGSLTSVRELASAPSFAKPSRARGAKREGIKYENKFAEALGSRARHGVWFEARDARGPLWAQVDVLLGLDGHVYIFECKYTWVAEAEEKLRGLYIPLVATHSGLPTHGIVVCKKLRPGAPPAVSMLSEALIQSLHTIPVLHWRPDWPLLGINSVRNRIFLPSLAGALA